MATSLSTASPRRLNLGMVGALNQEWNSKYADAPHIYEGGKVMSGTEALFFLQGVTGAARDGRFHFMLRCAAAGDATAERLVLQALLPKAVRFAGTCRGLQLMSREDALCSAVAAMWESIRVYNLDRTESVTGNLTLRALKLITTNYPAREQEPGVMSPSSNPNSTFAFQCFDRALPGSEAGSAPTAFSSSLDKVMAVLGWAADCGVLTPHEIKLLGTYSTLTVDECKAWAARKGQTYRNLCNQVSDIRSKLAKAIAQHELNNRYAW